ncbi:hypothetical protein NDN08_001600 [Rhodosorus marinus]|uniref:NAD(P)H-hydrate epimerase n=1 Tax=Rhodosorus marinus TaxID=101924 RepID=A0AAV8UR97_9RHOD|nr:hypothetical protein NDN08_001600 [Rhodosorus marinus]
MGFVNVFVDGLGLAQVKLRRRMTCSVRMSADKPEESLEQFASIQDAKELLDKVYSEYEGGKMALMTRFGTSSARVIADCFPEPANPLGIAICGTGDKGTVGFRAAEELSKMGFEMTVLACDDNPDFDEQMVRDAGLKYLDFVPGPIDAHFNFYIDAMVGVEYDNNELDQAYMSVIEKIANSERPTVSIDVPTGWHLTKGPKDEDLWRGLSLKPDLLISLGVPKVTARRFGGAFHYVVGNCLPAEEVERIKLKLPSFPNGSDFTLVGGNPALFGWGKKPGEVYGVEGGFQATMFPQQQSRRKWVDIDDDPEIWDELD